MNEIKLLILDDDQNVIDSFQGEIRRINRDDENDFSYKVYIADTLQKANEIIKYNKLDTAVIDLNLNNRDGTDPDNADGNIAIETLMKSFRMPIFVVSGEPDKLKGSLSDNHLVKLYTRDVFTRKKGFETIIPPIFLSKSIHYFSRDGFLEQKINKFYWEHLSQTIESWERVEDEYPGDIEKILSRHTLSCLNEELYVNGNIGSFDKYHPGEMYIIPPIKQHYHTGDIIEKDEEKYLIINPACDIVNKDKLEHYTIVKIYKATEIPKIKNKSLQNQENYINENLKKTNKLDRYHFLPMFDLFDEHYVIDFQNITIIKIGEDETTNYAEYLVEREKYIKKYKRIASIASPFLKDIIARFSAYYARQGQPNFL
jgi:hypothetical protein